MTTTEAVSLREKILSSTEEVLGRNVTRNEKLFAICELLEDEVSTFNWVGFYMADPDGKDELVLGPFVGASTDHTRIPFGKGICGQVALSHETFVAQDVHAQDNYLSCSIDVQSEIVVPIMVGDEFVAQLDIDSNTKNSITDEQKALLEEICDLIAEEF
ncbi:MAG: GAF domain-containing protein [Balneolaceae bacterium]